jgi:hypothetical protein
MWSGLAARNYRGAFDRGGAGACRASSSLPHRIYTVEIGAHPGSKALGSGALPAVLAARRGVNPTATCMTSAFHSPDGLLDAVNSPSEGFLPLFHFGNNSARTGLVIGRTWRSDRSFGFSRWKNSASFPGRRKSPISLRPWRRLTPSEEKLPNTVSLATAGPNPASLQAGSSAPVLMAHDADVI